MASAKQKQMPDVGARAPDFTLPDLSGQPKSLLEMLSSGAVVLGFFKIACPVCQYTFPFLERLHRAGMGASIRFVGISQDDEESTREFLEEFGITFPTLLEEAAGYPAGNAFGISHVPSLFLVGQDRTIQWTCEGFSKKALEELALRMGVKLFRPDEYVPEWRAG